MDVLASCDRGALLSEYFHASLVRNNGPSVMNNNLCGWSVVMNKHILLSF